MNAAAVRLFISRRFIDHDGSRRAVADGHVERPQDTEQAATDDALIAGLAPLREWIGVEAEKSACQQEGGSDD